MVELYQELFEFVVEHLPIDRTDLTAEFADAREAVQRMAADAAGPRFDLVIVDVFSGDVAPRHISTAEFFARRGDSAAPPTASSIVNTLASHGLGFTREALATLGSVFPHVIAVGNPGVTAGERDRQHRAGGCPPRRWTWPRSRRPSPRSRARSA